MINRTAIAATGEISNPDALPIANQPNTPASGIANANRVQNSFLLDFIFTAELVASNIVYPRTAVNIDAKKMSYPFHETIGNDARTINGIIKERTATDVTILLLKSDLVFGFTSFP